MISVVRNLGLLIGLLATVPAAAEIRVQDVASLQGRHTNRLLGYGLVTGLPGTGDGSASPVTLRALAQLHGKYHAPVLDIEELAATKNVAIVVVEARLPSDGARTGMALDVVVSAVGTAKSLRGGQLLPTPLQEATLALPDILAIAGGRIEIDPKGSPARGVIRQGAVLEEDLVHGFVEQGHITLVLGEAKSGFGWAHILARSIDAELQSFSRSEAGDTAGRRVVASQQFAQAISPHSVRVRVPDYYLDDPAPFISRVLAAPIFQEPRQQARVVINQTTNDISFTGSVSISPTVLVLPGLGTVAVGQGADASAVGTGVRGIATHQPDESQAVEFQALLAQLTQLQLSNEQMVKVVEHLHRTGTLHAELLYTE